MVVLNVVRLQLKCDSTRWRTGREVKGKLANAVGNQYSSHYLGTWCIQHYYRWWRTPRLPVVDWTDAPHGRFKWTRSFCAERRNLVSARVPLRFNWPLLPGALVRCDPAAGPRSGHTKGSVKHEAWSMKCIWISEESVRISRLSYWLPTKNSTVCCCVVQ